MQRYSRKRQAILRCLQNTYSHPTADQLFVQLRDEFPDLSLATVYRNLASLKAAGVIRSVGVIEGNERFDANVTPHPHAVCSKCGKVTDIFALDVPCNLISSAEAESGYSISEITVQFSGICKDCIDNNK